MRGILIDENLPCRLSLPTQLATQSVAALGESPSDSRIWKHARDRDMIIVTKDADFSHRIAAVEPPPRVVHIRAGNMRLRQLIAFVESAWPQVESHFPEAKLVDLYADRIEVVA